MKYKKIKHALILAAGRGSRMLPLTDILPKPMVPYLNTTLIGHGVDQLRNQIEKIHITVGYKKSMLAEHALSLDVNTIINTEGKGNCWVVYNTLISLINEPILVLTADNICQLDLDFIHSEYIRLNEPSCISPRKKIDGIDGDYIKSDGPI